MEIKFIANKFIKTGGTSSQFLMADGSVSSTVSGTVPVGGVVAWLKSLTGTPALDAAYVECNGQVLSDAGSVFNGVTIPNLNASGGGTKRFLRGSTTSGTTGGTETHAHNIQLVSGSGGSGGSYKIYAGTTDAASTLPSYYEVVYVMRIK